MQENNTEDEHEGKNQYHDGVDFQSWAFVGIETCLNKNTLAIVSPIIHTFRDLLFQSTALYPRNPIPSPIPNPNNPLFYLISSHFFFQPALTIPPILVSQI